MNKIGLIAGSGELPLVFLRQAKKKGVNVIVIEIEGEENKATGKFGFKKYRVKRTALSKMLKYIKAEKIKKIIMLGYVRHTNILRDIRFDLRTIKIFMSAKDLKAASVMKEIIKAFKKEGVTIIPTT